MTSAKEYGLVLTHPPNTCPVSNKMAREAAKKGFADMPHLSEKYNIKTKSLYHFDPEHLVIGIFEADDPESLRDFLIEAGLMHWNNLRFYPVTPVDKLMKEIDSIKTIF